MDRERIYNVFVDSGCILKGHFILSSGLRADTYVQCAMLFCNTLISASICSLLVDKVISLCDCKSIDCIVSPALGGVILGYELSSQFFKRGYKILNFFCEKHEGGFVAKRFDLNLQGKRVVIVEDVVTTGGSCLRLADYLIAQGAFVEAIFSLIDRRIHSAEISEHRLGCYLYGPLLQIDVPIFSKDCLPEHLQSIQPRYLGSEKGGRP